MIKVEAIATDILSLAAVVAAYVGVVKAYGVDSKHSHVIALAIAAVFVLVPEFIQQKLLLISVVGLTASGAYQYVKKRDDGNGQGN